jgi:hypothetical protein
MIWLTDAKSKQKIAINPKHVVAVFVASESEFVGKTVVGLINGQVVVDETDIEVVGQLQGASK